jgi:hypothetical protein
VCAEPEPTARFSTHMQHPWHLFGSDVILELKFTNRFPEWFGDLVRVFKLAQCGAAKYCEGVAAIGEYRLGSRIKEIAALDDAPARQTSVTSLNLESAGKSASDH